MLDKAKAILKNEQGMESIEVIGMGVVALLVIGLFFNATKSKFDSTTTKVGDGLGQINSLEVGSSKLEP